MNLVVPVELWRGLRQEAAASDRTLRDVAEEALWEHLKRQHSQRKSA